MKRTAMKGNAMKNMINAKLDIAYFDARGALTDVPARVMLDGTGLTLITAGDGNETVLWHGERRGQGHYILRAQTTGMDASLHRFADSTILEGFWRDGRDRGFWRLHLPVDAVIPRDTRVAKAPAKAVAPRAKPAARKRARRTA